MLNHNKNVDIERDLDDMLLSEEADEDYEQTDISISAIDLMKIDPFAPVKIESFDLTADDTPTPENIENVKALGSYKGHHVFEI